ncbi:Spo0B C-terminal domain-containing protein [Camelliibacillus cellulosilyticus]|uniref:Spo0B C-terminal domain-containing protein n=1 Tax=Camelliibacillus cellulosilyticus TaxID=2174486 RepID=A0ABV9GLU3_9BACL
MESEQQVIELLRAARHDWLNQLQLIKAGLALKNIERAEQIIDEIIIKAKNEAHLSNLNIPRTAAYLLTFNWSSHALHLDIEVMDAESDLSGYDKALYDLAKAVLDLFEQCIGGECHNEMVLLLETDPAIQVTFDFVGNLTVSNKLREAITETGGYQSFRLVKEYITEKEAVIKYRYKGES